MKRRDFLKLAGAVSLAGCAGTASSKGRVVVIGGGYGGATAAKYIRLWDPSIEVVMVERENVFSSCPISNLVLGGYRSMDDIRRGYDGLRTHGVQIVNDEATAVDAAKKVVRLQRGGDLTYDRLIVSPGVDFLFGEVEGYADAMNSGRVLHAWKAGSQTVELRKQLVAMKDGGVYVLSVPAAPYRCPPGPYERTCQVASYFKQAKPRSKVLVLDANPDVMSKGPLFKRAWEDLYKGIVEYRPGQKAVGIDAGGMAVKLEFDSVRGDVLNVVPPHRAGDIAVKAAEVAAVERDRCSHRRVVGNHAADRRRVAGAHGGVVEGVLNVGEKGRRVGTPGNRRGELDRGAVVVTQREGPAGDGGNAATAIGCLADIRKVRIDGQAEREQVGGTKRRVGHCSLRSWHCGRPNRARAIRAS